MINIIQISILITLLFCFISFHFVNGISVDRDLSLNLQEKEILDKFREMMSPILPHDYMKKEIYLVRWLRAEHFNLEAAKDLLLKNLEWRKENQMDTITSEYFGEFESQYSFTLSGHDKDLRPLIITNLGEYDLRKVVTTGQLSKFKRLIHRSMEECAEMIRKYQKEGKEVTQYYHIYNMEGFNLVQHACSQFKFFKSLSLVFEAIRMHDFHYPGFAHRVTVVNAPGIFLPIMETFKAAARKETREILKIFGRNKKQWQTQLLEDIDATQLPLELGGTKISENYDY